MLLRECSLFLFTWAYVPIISRFKARGSHLFCCSVLPWPIIAGINITKWSPKAFPSLRMTDDGPTPISRGLPFSCLFLKYCMKKPRNFIRAKRRTTVGNLIIIIKLLLLLFIFFKILGMTGKGRNVFFFYLRVSNLASLGTGSLIFCTSKQAFFSSAAYFSSWLKYSTGIGSFRLGSDRMYSTWKHKNYIILYETLCECFRYTICHFHNQIEILVGKTHLVHVDILFFPHYHQSSW